MEKVSSYVYVDSILLDDVVDVEFSSKHLLLRLLVGDDIAVVVEDLKRPHSFRVIVRPGAFEHQLDGLRFDRVNYTNNTPSGLWVAELRFVAKLSAVADDQETS